MLLLVPLFLFLIVVYTLTIYLTNLIIIFFIPIVQILVLLCLLIIILKVITLIMLIVPTELTQQFLILTHFILIMSSLFYLGQNQEMMENLYLTNKILIL